MHWPARARLPPVGVGKFTASSFILVRSCPCTHATPITDRGGANASGCCRGSFIGGVKRTQEVIELCDREKIYPETTVHPVEKLNEIFEWLDGSNDAGTRYVLDIKVRERDDLREDI